jgi:hypothetical protein
LVEPRVNLIETCINRGESRVNLFESFTDARESLIHLHSEEVDVILGGNVAPANWWEVCHENVGHTKVYARDAHVGGNSYVAWPAS